MTEGRTALAATAAAHLRDSARPVPRVRRPLCVCRRSACGSCNGMTTDGFMIWIQSPAAKVVGESPLALIADGDRVALYEAMRQQLLPIPAASEFTVAVPEFIPTEVHFRSLPTAAMAMFSRARAGAAVSNLVGAAFIFSGKNPADEDEVIRRTSGGRDANRQPYPIPPSNYEKIRSEPARPLLNRAYFIVRVPSDPVFHAWGGEGHQLVALIAEDHLTPAAHMAARFLRRSRSTAVAPGSAYSGSA